jgi:hypothetical protein
MDFNTLDIIYNIFYEKLYNYIKSNTTRDLRDYSLL